MFDKIIAYSVHNKFVIGIMILALIGWGSYSLTQLPIDAIPDITNNQVQVITNSPNLAAQEIEKFITSPIELSLQNLPNVVELRSISRFGFSLITVVFEDDMGMYLPRELVAQQLKMAETEIPEGLGTPEMTPISSGLGEIYQYTLSVKKGYEEQFDAMKLREIQDWIVKRQLSGIKGVIEVNSFGGKLKQYEVTVEPSHLKAMDITITEIFDALENSNENTGGAYIEKDPNAYFIRAEGLAETPEDIEKIVVKNRNGTPILIRDVAKVQLGFAPRFGALSRNGDGEVVGGIVMMLKGANAAQVMSRVEDRMAQIKKSLPEGVEIIPYLVRSKLINNAIHTVEKNLLEGGLIVVFILVLLLGNWRAGLIVASVIPLAMLFAVSMMNVFGVTANLMSLGAIDFGLIVDGAVIVVEAIVYRLSLRQANTALSQAEMDATVTDASMKIRSSAAFGEIIILIVYLPILALSGIEGKTFAPMAQTVGFAIFGALILSLTYVPMMSALILSKKNIKHGDTFSDKIIGFFQRIYAPVLNLALRFKTIIVVATVLFFGFTYWQFSKLGGEFIPTLEEGDLALHQILPPGSSLEKSVEVSTKLQNIIMENFPEVEQVVTKMGTAEIPTDLMSMETGDIMVILKPKSEWTSAKTREELVAKMEEKMLELPGISYEFTQPIQMRFNELMTGSRADIAIQIYGDDLNLLFQSGKKVEKLIENLDGVTSVTVDQLVGMPQIIIRYDYNKLAEYGLQIKFVNTIVRTAFAGEKAGVIYEGDRRFDLVVRMPEHLRKDIDNVRDLLIPLENGQTIPLTQIASVALEKAPMQIARDNTKRKITIGANALNRDVASLVAEIESVLDEKLELPTGYFITYGGQFENLQNATKRLKVAVPVALLLIFALLYLTFNSFKQAALIFTAIPLAAIGGVWALVLRDMPFSISAGIGFIALFGVAVLNGIVLIGYFNQLKEDGIKEVKRRIIIGTNVRLRPVIMTALVASLGFLPMALSSSGGAEVQRPLATVVIGGLITATLLTLVVLPILYSWIEKDEDSEKKSGEATDLTD
jgi:cobalt-zinc-cadmium resistance protein CzcA